MKKIALFAVAVTLMCGCKSQRCESQFDGTTNSKGQSVQRQDFSNEQFVWWLWSFTTNNVSR